MNRKVPEFAADYQSLAKICLILLAVGALYYPVIRLLVRDWLELPDFSHGFFVPLVSLYFLWERSEALDNASISPSNWGVIVLLTGAVLLLLGNLAAEYFTMRFSLLIVLCGIVLYLLGPEHFKLLLFPIAYLIFMIPIPSLLLGKITFPMQLFASKVATVVVQSLGIPILRQGNIISLTNTTLEIAEACSGIRSMITLLALGVAFAYLTKKQFWQRALLVFSCFPIAILVNAARVSATAVLADSYGTEVALGFLHGFSGLLLFCAAFVLLVATGSLISWIGKSEEKGRPR